MRPSIEDNGRHENTTMYKNNSRNSSKFKDYKLLGFIRHGISDYQSQNVLKSTWI